MTKTCPDETPDEMYARIEAEHGPAAAETARRLVEGELRPRSRMGKRPIFTGKRGKRTPTGGVHRRGRNRS